MAYDNCSDSNRFWLRKYFQTFAKTLASSPIRWPLFGDVRVGNGEESWLGIQRFIP